MAVPERLQRRALAQQEATARRRQERAAQAVPEERSEVFAAAFARERDAVEALLAPGPPEAAVVEEAAERLQALQRRVTDAVRFLAPYELRQAQETLARLQAALGGRRQQLQPQKRFAFSARKKEAPPPAPDTPAPHPPEGSGEEVAEAGPPLCGFRGAEGQVLELGPDELRQQDVVLAELCSCRVLLRGNPNTLRVSGCRNCTVLCGPVSTSVMVDGCHGCTLALACQQLRTHATRDTQLYTAVVSRTVLEGCTSIRLAPYSWTYPGIEADFEASGLDLHRCHCNLVDDFNWLVPDQPSPNWSIIREDEQVTCWD
ncbi:tubulin-specific chaperone C [Alligator mississippiensis]|uniref:Tubulin-specific chaperone C n=2 Tax=Alligator mississippiensis TaxID=8496 RepID=A0A151P416_ALLMI|nr:tubulin-specific chaperone C [Alligator mississippiensis]